MTVFELYASKLLTYSIDNYTELNNIEQYDGERPIARLMKKNLISQKLPPGRIKKVLNCSVPQRSIKLYNSLKNVRAIPADFQTWTLQKRTFTKKIIANFIKGNPNLPQLIY